MGQQDSNFVGNYADSLANGPGNQKPQNDPPMPLATTDSLKSNGSGDDSSNTNPDGTQSVNYKDLGQAAATHDFQQAHGNGWTYDPDAMKEQIGRLENIRDVKLYDIEQNTEAVVGITAPAQDKVSGEFIEVANRSGKSHNEQFNKYKNYITAYVETLYKIDKMYQNEDEKAVQELLSKEL